MPFHRIVRFLSPLVAWYELVLAESAPDWSSSYRAETPRLLVPGTRWIEAEQRGRRFVCDALTPLILVPDEPYRTRQPFAGQRSIVLVFESGDGGPQWRAGRLRFSTAAQWRLARCRAALDRGVPDRLGFEEQMLALLPTAFENGYARSGDRKVERAREYLASDPSSDASLLEIARAVAVSPFHLARCFKRDNGIGLHGYRTRLRMGLALASLGDGADDLTRLALDLGFSSHSHFTAAFRAHFGVAPSRARVLLASRARIR